MKQKLILASIAFAVLLFSQSAMAVPFLQLDASDGVYVGGNEESIVPTTNPFTLYALADYGSNKWENEDYFISIALISDTVPITEGGGVPAFGSFDFDGTTYNSGGPWTYGVPPASLDANPGLLGPHDVFPTYFLELSFMFDPNNKAAEYNTQDNPGGFMADANGDLYYAAFAVDIAGLSDDFHLHFDLYSKDGDKIDEFAPFSHDAVTNGVPEPGTVFLLGIGLIGLAGLGRKRYKS